LDPLSHSSDPAHPLEGNRVALSLKNVPETLQDLKDLLISYAKQETVDPLRNLGRYLGFGLAGMALLTLGTFFLGMALLRFLQTMVGGVFDGFWSWVPYVIVMIVFGGAIALALSRVDRGGIGAAEPALAVPANDKRSAR
jgi:hypothetical protein